MNSSSRHSAFLVFRSINLNSAKSAPRVNRALPMTMWKFFIFITHTYPHICIYQAKFWAFNTSTVNIVLATCCLAGLNRILWPQSFNVWMTALRICLFLFWKLPGKAYNASCHLRVSGLVSDLIFQNLGHLIEVVNRFHNFDFPIFYWKEMFFDNSSGLSIGWVSAFNVNHWHIIRHYWFVRI